MNPEVDPNLPTETDAQPETVTPQPESEPTVTPTTETTPPADPESEIDYKAKFAESTREAQIIQAQLEEERAKNARKELTKEPTDSEIQTAFPEWELMTDTEKRLARETFTARRIVTSLQQKDEEREAQGRWNTDLELTIASNPSLQGKEQAFKAFANKPTHRGAPLATLVSAFLFESSSTPAVTPTPTPAAPGLEPGTGGPKTPDKPKQLTGEQLKLLRQTDDKKYREYIKTHDTSQLAD